MEFDEKRTDEAARQQQPMQDETLAQTAGGVGYVNICQECGQVFLNAGALLTHQRDKHGLGK